MAQKPAPTPQPLSLEGDLDIFAIHAQWERIQPLLGVQEGTASLDLAGVGDLDLSGVQMLMALERDLRAKGIRLALTGVRPEWGDRFRPLGLGEVFQGEAAP